MIPARLIRLCAVLLAVFFGLPQDGAAQSGTAGRSFAQAGLAGLPGLGLQLGYVGPRSIYTAEVILYTDGSTRLPLGDGTVKVSVGIGGALRPLGIVRVIGNADHSYDLDVGLRFGPSFLFDTDPTRSDKNQQFSLFLDPFFRFTRRLGSGRILFAELGVQRPSIRAGVWFGL